MLEVVLAERLACTAVFVRTDLEWSDKPNQSATLGSHVPTGRTRAEGEGPKLTTVGGSLVMMKEIREILLAVALFIGIVVFGMFFYGLLEMGQTCRFGDDGTVVGASCAK